MNKGHILALATAAASGIAVFYNASAMKGIDPLAFTLAKNALCAFFLAGIVLMFGAWKEFATLKRPQWLTLLSIAFVGGSIPFALFFWGLANAASAGGASLIYRLMFFFASALAVFLLKERPKANVALGVGIILLANLLVLGKFEFGAGEAAVLAATLLWAAENVISKRALAEISPLVIASSRMMFGSIILLGAMSLFGVGQISAGAFGIGALVSALFLLIFVLTYYNALAIISVSEATAILSAGGIVSAALQFSFAGKVPTLAEGTSLLLIAAGTALILWGAPIIGSIASRATSGRLSPWKA